MRRFTVLTCIFNRLVSDAMGGAVKRDNLHGFLWVLHLCELKMELKSNVVPIGLIKRGLYCHRALLFKVSLNQPPRYRLSFVTLLKI